MLVAITLDVAAILPVGLVGAAAVQVQDSLSLSDTRLGLAVSAYFLCGAALAIGARDLIDHLGWHRSIWAAAACTTTALLLIGLTADTFGMFSTGMAVGGWGWPS